MAVYMIFKYSKRFRFAPSFNKKILFYNFILCNFLVQTLQCFQFYFFNLETLRNHPKKLLIIESAPIFFQYCQLAQIQPKSQFLFHKNCSPRDLCIMTLYRTSLFAGSHRSWKTKFTLWNSIMAAMWRMSYFIL